MNAASTSIEQQAKISLINGNVQLIRDGFFLPAQPGMVLLPGDRVVSDAAGKAVIEFTGVNDALVIENGSAATFNLEVVELDEAPQWIATDLYGQGVYFDSQAAESTAATTDTPDLFGLFGSTNASGGDSTAYPVFESILALGATAVVFSDNDNNNDTETTATASESETGGTGAAPNPPPPNTPENPQEPQPEPNPLSGILEPVTGAVEGLLGLTGTASPLVTQSNPDLPNTLFGSTSATS